MRNHLDKMQGVLPKILVSLAGLSVLVGAGLVIYGLCQMTWPSAIPLAGNMRLRYVFLLLIAGVLVASISVAARLKPLAAAATAVTLLALVAGLVGPFAVVALFVLASTLLGRGVLSFVNMVHAEERASVVLPFLIGAGLYGSAVGLLANFPLNYPGLYAVMLFLPIVLAWKSAAALLSAIAKSMVRSSRNRGSYLVLDGAIGVLLIVYALVACLPELGYDALAMHLFIPGYLRGRHQWNFDVTNYIWAVMPMLGDWIFAIGYMLGGETAARLINVAFIFVIARLVVEMVRWAGGTSRGAQWAALVFLSLPLTFTEGSSLFIESIWGAFVIAGAFYLLRAVSARGNISELMIAGGLLGFAAASKAVTLSVLPVFVLVLALHWRKIAVKSAVQPLAIALLLFFIVGATPYIRAFAITGNPVFPLFIPIFRSPSFPLETFVNPHMLENSFEAPIFGKGVQWNTLYAITFDSARFLEAHPGVAGFHFLLLLIPALLILIGAWNVRGLLVAIIALASIALTFMSTAYLRYVFPAFALLAVVLGIGFSALRFNVLAARAAGVFLTAGTCLNLLFLNAGAFYGYFKPEAVFSESLRREYIQLQRPVRNAVDLINKLNTGHTPVAMFSMPYAAGLESDVLHPNWYNFKFYEAIMLAKSENDIAEVLLNRGVDFVIVDSAWGELLRREMIEGATEKIVDFGSVSVRSVGSRYRFQKELLLNPTFESGEGWTILPGAKLNRGLVATVSAPAYQMVPVSPGQRYRNVVRAICTGESTQGRLQVNWQDAQSKFIQADIKTFDCSSKDTDYDMEVIAPDGASFAAIYASSHTSVPVNFKQVSFKK